MPNASTGIVPTFNYAIVNVTGGSVSTIEVGQLQKIYYGAPGTGKSWEINKQAKGLVTAKKSKDMGQLYLDWLPRNGVVAKKDNYVKTLASISEAKTGTHNTAEWPGCFEQFIGKKPEKKIFEVTSLAEFNSVYGPFDALMQNLSEAADAESGEDGEGKDLKEFFDWATKKGEGNTSGLFNATFNKYKQFLKWVDSDKGSVNVFRTTFHPDSDYSTFVGAYKPTKTEDGGITYNFRPQAFINAYVRAWNVLAGDDSNKNVMLVIEEVNRGNCAQIFGDIFQLLDRGDDGWSTYPINADEDLALYLSERMPPISDDKKPSGMDVGDWSEIKSGKKLALPPNLYIRATMNTSDQSLFPIDSAFKRRWDWEYVPIKDEGKGWYVKVGEDKYKWWSFLEKINEIVITETQSADKQLGYFFVKLPDGQTEIDLKKFVNKVAFYLWNDVFKDCEVVDDALKLKVDSGKAGDPIKFTDFFDSKTNEINKDVVKNLFEGLGVEKVKEKSEEKPVAEA